MTQELDVQMYNPAFKYKAVIATLIDLLHKMFAVCLSCACPLTVYVGINASFCHNVFWNHMHEAEQAHSCRTHQRQ